MHSNREEWLKTAVEELRPIFDAVNFPLPDRIRVTCGFPSSRARANNAFIGEHWSPAASTDDHHEILISPVVDDPLQVFSTLVHELCHAATDGHGHDRVFLKCARSLWLEGKPTATVAGDAFKANFSNVIESLGAYPHARLNIEAIRKKQSTRMLKAVCPDCGFTVRLSQAWADKGLPVCSADNNQFVLA
jgi:ribosomal protein L37E